MDIAYCHAILLLGFSLRLSILNVLGNMPCYFDLSVGVVGTQPNSICWISNVASLYSIFEHTPFRITFPPDHRRFLISVHFGEEMVSSTSLTRASRTARSQLGTGPEDPSGWRTSSCSPLPLAALWRRASFLWRRRASGKTSEVRRNAM